MSDSEMKMTTKQHLLSILTSAGDDYLSGSKIAKSLGISRAAVWKQIRALSEDGYEIEAVTNRGYRLAKTNDVLSEACVRRYLWGNESPYTLEVYDEITSTNTVMKANADHLPEWHAILAGMQTAGRGRSGRSFYSPGATGLYLSVLLKPAISASDATRITTAAAVAACQAIEDCTDATPAIKWVNDVFVNGKKVCGILTEASLDLESGGLAWAVMGIGFDVYEPEGGYPEELKEIAGAIAKTREKDLRARLAAAFLRHFYELCRDLVEEYRKRSFLIGQSIEVYGSDKMIPAVAVDVDDECRLIVRYDDGREEALSSGEVRVRLVK